MNKLVASVLFTVPIMVLGSCASNPEEPTPFEQSISKNNKYDSDAVVDGRYLDKIDVALEQNKEIVRRTDEEYIRYAKSICNLLDQAKDLQVIPENYDGRNIDQPISQAAIQVYCPHHLPK